MGNRQHFYIKNMVCDRCIRTVEQVFTDAGWQVEQVQLGEVIASKQNPDAETLAKDLEKEGFELIRDKETQLSEQIKATLIDYLNHLEKEYQPLTISYFLSEKLNQPYPQLSKIFSKSEQITIEKYLIKLKIEKVKELLSYNELTLSQIAHLLKYSSVQHLSRQFKQVTGLTVSEFKDKPNPPRLPLDQIISGN